MKYEEFEARAKSAFDDCSEMKRMLWNMQTVVGAVPDMVRKNERFEKEKADLKAENAALKVELDDWKGNAEGFEPDAYMRLPVDADGVPIRIGDTVYANDGSEFSVRSITVTSEGSAIGVNPLDGFCFCPSMKPERLSHRAPEPADGWEKLEEDAKDSACRYFGRFLDGPIVTCSNCPISKRSDGRTCAQHMQIDLVKRAKRIAWIEEQEGGERTAIADNEEER